MIYLICISFDKLLDFLLLNWIPNDKPLPALLAHVVAWYLKHLGHYNLL